ncbi:MAG: ParB/RepB/Spo0J family partition protein [Fimbriimonadaceae bacterium]|nr:ParB/RepB/Spo0J family partition protein [Fimbriimonadaceae bacterium]
MRRALGRGLSQLFAEQFETAMTEVSVEAISANARQPRKHFDEETLAELAESIRVHGILQPLLVRPVTEGQFELIAGERRLRAAKLAKLTTVPVIVRSSASQSSLELALIENVQREDISAIECGLAYRQLIEEFGMTQEEVAARVGKSRAAVANAIRLLKLPEEAQDAVLAGAISEGHARALLALPDDARILEVLERILTDQLTVRDVERLANPQREIKTPGARPKSPATRGDTVLEDALREFFQTPVALRRTRNGGKLTLDFYSEDDLGRILDRLGIRL